MKIVLMLFAFLHFSFFQTKFLMYLHIPWDNFSGQCGKLLTTNTHSCIKKSLSVHNKSIIFVGETFEISVFGPVSQRQLKNICICVNAPSEFKNVSKR
jgi:hypothetical protein